MIKDNLKKKIVSAVVLGSVVTSLGMTAFASDLNQDQVNQKINSQKELGMKQRGDGKGQERMNEKLKESGIFTDAEIEEIKTYLESKKSEMCEEKESLRDKTEEERKAYFEANKDKKQDMMSELVTDGVITQDQLDKLKEIAPQEKSFGKNKNHEKMTDHLKESGVFTDGEIEEIKAYFEANKGKRQNIMSELVTDGVITQEQLDKLKETMPQKRVLKNKY